MLTLPESYQRQAVLGTCLLLALFLLVTVIYAGWRWHSDWLAAHREVSAVSDLSETDTTDKLLAALPSAHLFGQSLQAGDMPISSLQFHVTGIVKMDGDAAMGSKAYISIGGQPGKIYQVGDSLPYGVHVYEITPDAVILQNDSHLEKLPLAREKLVFKPRDTEEMS